MSRLKSSTQSSPSQLTRPILLLVVIVAVLVAVKTRPAPKAVAVSAPPSVASTAQASTPATRPTVNESAPTEEVEEPKYNAQQDYLVENFRDQKRDWQGFKRSGVVLSSTGVSLEAGATNGVFESPVQTLKLPSNMIVLLWKENRSELAAIKPEVSISGDGQTWSDWYAVQDSGNDINPVYPDDTPNPNYGYVHGTRIFTPGKGLVSFARYRFTLSRRDAADPTPELAAIRLHHLDSTLGEGSTAQSFAPYPSPAANVADASGAVSAPTGQAQ